MTKSTLLIITLLTISLASFCKEKDPLFLHENNWEVFKELTLSEKKLVNSLSKKMKAKETSIAPCQDIPKVFHFIWIGPKPFPSSSIPNLKSWLKHHPDYSFVFWSDRQRENIPTPFQLKIISSNTLTRLSRQFNNSTNMAEKADLLRYEILLQQGGIYVDHDVECYQSLNKLIQDISFFAGTEPPHTPVGDQSITVCNNIIGTKPNHPILEKTIRTVESNWNVISKRYPLNSKENQIRKVFYSTFKPFSDAVLESLDEPLIFVAPPSYFNNLSNKQGYFANHQYASTWFDTETKFEKFVRKNTFKELKKLNLIILLFSLFFLLTTFILVSVFFIFKRLKKIYINDSRRIKKVQ